MYSHFRPHKAQYTYLQIRIERLGKIASSYIESLENKSGGFPYSSLHDLQEEISLIKDNTCKCSLLESLNDTVVSSLVNHNPKLNELYQANIQRINELKLNIEPLLGSTSHGTARSS